MINKLAFQKTCSDIEFLIVVNSLEIAPMALCVSCGDKSFLAAASLLLFDRHLKVPCAKTIKLNTPATNIIGSPPKNNEISRET